MYFKRNMKRFWKRNIISSACFVKECWARLSRKNTVGGNGCCCVSESIFKKKRISNYVEKSLDGCMSKSIEKENILDNFEK